MERLDVVIVGAGISGIGAAYHLQTECPGMTYAILEGRERIGGTWDLFRYPGIRSDSDMFTLGYSFRPWKEAKAIADGQSIRRYVEETAEEYGIDRHIRFGHCVTRASWSTDEARWTVTAKNASGQSVEISARFLFMCAGYYDYDGGHTPELPGIDRFRGRVVHPQKWTDDIDYEGKRVVVIGSGATAVTLVPEMAKRAAHVTMLQRSPSYVVSMPSEDPLAKSLRHRLPLRAAYGVTRWKNILLTIALYNATQQMPRQMRRLFMYGVRKELGPDYDVATHFNPRYDPWDERLCLVPDADLFVAIREGRASVVTETIDSFTTTGIRLTSGEELPADLVVTATGLRVCFAGKAELLVDGRAIDPSALWTYKGMMFSGMPNFAVWFGYINASWTLKADLTSAYVCRLLQHMERHGHRWFVPRRADENAEALPFLGLKSGYVKRALSTLPKQGAERPWRVYQNYILDLLTLRLGRLDDDAMELH